MTIFNSSGQSGLLCDSKVKITVEQNLHLATGLPRAVVLNRFQHSVKNWTPWGRGHWAAYYNIPQSFKIHFLFVWLSNFGDYYLILIGWFIKLSVQTFQPIFVIYRRGNFVNHPFCSKRLRDFLMISLQQVCACTWCFWTWCCWCLVGESCPPTRPA